MVSLPVITQEMLVDINPNFRHWPLIDLMHIERSHLNQLFNRGEFCYMDTASLDVIVKAVFIYGDIVERYNYEGKTRWRMAANMWIPIGFCLATGEVTHTVSVIFCTVDWTIGMAYPGGFP